MLKRKKLNVQMLQVEEIIKKPKFQLQWQEVQSLQLFYFEILSLTRRFVKNWIKMDPSV